MIKKSVYGALPDGRKVWCYAVENRTGSRIEVITFGAIVTYLYVPDRNGIVSDVVLGYDTLSGYIDDTFFIGAIVGRYANRIAGGRFRLNSCDYQLPLNDGSNHLHGGPAGFYKVLWDAEPVESAGGQGVRLSYISPDGEQGYPGTLELYVTYALSEANELIIEYSGVTNKPTILNPTHHSYFNLSGDFTRTILEHELEILADRYTPVSRDHLPTGKLAGVAGTPLDFRVSRPIGQCIEDRFDQLIYGGGFDHNWVLNDYDGTLRKAASVYDPLSGRIMEVFTDQPGIQFYSGNFLDGTVRGKNGTSYQKRSGLCLETQHFPDSPNHPDFPPVTLLPGETYHQHTIYKFSVR